MPDNDEPLAHDDTGEGPTLVLVHGLTFSRRTWDPVVDRLSDRFRCIAVDLPGHGASTGSAAEPMQVAHRLRRTLTALDVPAPVVIGHSAGALNATGYAATYPVAGVIDVDQPLLVGPFAGMLQQLADRLAGPDFEAAFAPFEDSIGVQRLPEPERSRVAGTRRVDQATVLDHWTLPMTTPPDDLQRRLDGLLDAITVPYLYLGGEEPPPPVRDHLAAHLQNLEVVAWPGRGHLVHLAEPDRFAELVADFAGRVAAPARA